MAKIKLTIAYDGTGFVGWQVQPNGESIQLHVEQALEQLLGAPVRVCSSGRTDAGVHALGMVCHFETERILPMSAWRDGANRFLPAAIAIRSAEVVADDFHARYDARGKHYRYTLLCDAVRDPISRNFCWQVRQPLDLQAMNEAAGLFVGEHDFAAFRTSGCAARTTRRKIFSLELKSAGRFIYIDVRGSGFLKNMVRMMVGVLVEIGRGKRPVADVERLLQREADVAPALTAPAQGLCLHDVWYDGD